MEKRAVARGLREHWPIIAIAIVASVLILMNLGNQYLWQDEAETALIAKTVLADGIPQGHDDKNFFNQQEAAGSGKGYLTPWFQFYWLAAFFALFGESTFVARLPFALFAIATVPLVYFFARNLWGTRRAGVLAAVLLIANVWFLVLTRQCRYYAPAIFFTAASLYAYWALVQGRKRAWLWFGLSALLLFHTQYTQCAAVLGATLSHCLLFHRPKLKVLALTSATVVLLASPWIVWFSWTATSRPMSSLWALMLAFAEVDIHLIAAYVFPLWAIAALVVFWALNAAKRRSWWGLEPATWQWLALLVGFVAAEMVVVTIAAPYPFFRYLGPTFAVSALILALVAEAGMRINPVLGLLVPAAVILANPVGRYPEHVNGVDIVQESLWSFQNPVRDYFYEITHDYDGPVEGIVKYLRKHAHKGDLVLITYEDLPVKFYTDLRVLGGLTGEDPTPARYADWIIIRKHAASDLDMQVRQFIYEHIPLEEYKAVILNYPDTPYENREDPSWHLFRTAREDPVVIFRRIEQQARK